MSIPFTQYMRPDGRRKDAEIERSAEIEKLAERFIAAGGVYECEHLRTGHASLTAGFNGADIAIEVVPNGPKVPDAVDKLVRRSIEWLEGKPLI